MLNLPIYSNKKLITAFEYGIVMSQVAKERGMELSPETVKKAEEIIKNEFIKNDWKQLNIEMIPNILASFEV